MKFKINKETPLSNDLIRKLLDLHTSDEVRKQRLGDYYIGKQAILNRVMSDKSKPNNKIVHSYGNYITDSVVGYFMGQPIKYAAKDSKFEGLTAKIKEIFEYNDEQAENIELAKDASKYGKAYELLWIDEDSEIRFTRLDSIHSFPIFDNSLNEELLYFVRYYPNDLTDLESHTVEVYSGSDVSFFQWKPGELYMVNEIPHNFGSVPVAIYLNNQEGVGDYELVVSLIDAYDKLNSDSVNDFELFADAYLTLKGMDSSTTEDVAEMKNNRILLLPQDGEAEWLVKNINDTYFQNTISTLDKDIHKFAKIPNMMDESFGSNLSGIAIKYKLIALENKVSIKESYFKKGLQKRIELINRILNLMGGNFEYLGLDIIFSRNLPVNELEQVQMANQVNGLVSDETMLSLLSFVNDAAKELDKRNSQLDSIQPILPLENNIEVNQTQ